MVGVCPLLRLPGQFTPWRSDPGPTLSTAFLSRAVAARRRDTAAWRHRQQGESVPHVSTYIRPDSLAIFLGSEPETVEGSVWFHEPEEWTGELDTLRFDERNVWWRHTERLFRAMQERTRNGAYLIACPDLVENWEVLASLMVVTNLLMRMVDDPSRLPELLNEIGSEGVFLLGYDLEGRKLAETGGVDDRCDPCFVSTDHRVSNTPGEL